MVGDLRGGVPRKRKLRDVTIVSTAGMRLLSNSLKGYRGPAHSV